MEPGSHHRMIEITTPENIPLQMPLVGAIDRAEAFFLDFCILFVITTVVAILFVLAANIIPSLSYWLIALFLVLRFFLWGGYFIYYELKYGATIGKKRRRYKVVAESGSFLPASSIYVRNLMREVELWIPIWVFIFMTFGGTRGANAALPFLWVAFASSFPIFDRHNRRLGDILAGTVVISTDKIALERDLVTHGKKEKKGDQKIGEDNVQYTFTSDQLDIYGVDELQTLEEIIRKSPQMPRSQKKKLYSTLVEKITRKIKFNEYVPPREEADFLQQFYQAQRVFLEKKLIRGKSLERRSQRAGAKRPKRRDN